MEINTRFITEYIWNQNYESKKKKNATHNKRQTDELQK